MTGHTFACALYCSPGGGLNGLGNGLVVGFFILCGLALAIGAIRAVVAVCAHAKSPRPREPLADMSPRVLGLLNGMNMPAYTAPVRAVTPRGLLVRYGRCCQRGHQTPQQAAGHAGRIRHRIEVNGR